MIAGTLCAFCNSEDIVNQKERLFLKELYKNNNLPKEATIKYLEELKRIRNEYLPKDAVKLLKQITPKRARKWRGHYLHEVYAINVRCLRNKDEN